MPDGRRYTELQDWRRTPIFDVGDALARSRPENKYDPSNGAGRMMLADGIIGLANRVGQMLKTYEEVIRASDLQSMVRDIHEQLAPDQDVRIIVNLETNRVLSIERPGHGYLLPDNKTIRYFDSEKADELAQLRLRGADGGFCRSNPLPEVTEFSVRDGDGKRRIIILDERVRPQEKEPNAEDSGDDKAGRRGPKRRDEIP